MRWLKACALLFWYGLGAYLVLVYLRFVLLAPWQAVFRPEEGQRAAPEQVLALLTALLGLAVLVGAFVLLHLGVRSLPTWIQGWMAWLERHEREAATKRRTSRTPPTPGEAFPTPLTLGVGTWLLVSTGVNVLFLLLVLEPPGWLVEPPARLARVIWALDPETSAVQDMLVTMFAAGVGSSISIILGYLDHACIKKDFDAAYTPWYVVRPLMGILVGLVFYFVLKGGLLATGAAPVNADGDMGLNDIGLAGLGALVGLFSKHALEKLREVFDTLFSTQRDFAAELKRRLPSEKWEEIRQYLDLQEPEAPTEPPEGTEENDEPKPDADEEADEPPARSP